jgi:aconitate hydratase
VIARSFARIHRQNLINFGILPLTFVDPDDWKKVEADDVLKIADLLEALKSDSRVKVVNLTRDETYTTEHSMSDREVEMVLAGGMVNVVRGRRAYASAPEGVRQ